MKILFYDLETTGVKHWRNGIHQFSGMLESDGEVIEELNYRIQPNPSCTIDEEALKVGGVTMEQVLDYPEMGLVYTELVAILGQYVNKFDKADKIHLCGYNNRSFDDQFFRAWFTQNGDKYFGSWFWPDSIDVMVLASNHLKHERHLMKNFKLSTVAEYLGIEVDQEKLHDAMYDIELTRKVYYMIEGLTRGHEAS